MVMSPMLICFIIVAAPCSVGRRARAAMAHRAATTMRRRYVQEPRRDARHEAMRRRHRRLRLLRRAPAGTRLRRLVRIPVTRLQAYPLIDELAISHRFDRSRLEFVGCRSATFGGLVVMAAPSPSGATLNLAWWVRPRLRAVADT
jgi:hypothetical protein